jgi:hypothetical protein
MRELLQWVLPWLKNLAQRLQQLDTPAPLGAFYKTPVRVRTTSLGQMLVVRPTAPLLVLCPSRIKHCTMDPSYRPRHPLNRSR